MPEPHWVSVTFEMDLNVMHIERSIYTVFDMLSDVGGLLGILTSFAAYLSQIWNFQAFDNFMVSRLFKVRKPKQEIDDEAPYFAQSDFIQLGTAPNLRNWVLQFVPHGCFCCKYRRKERALQLARTKLACEGNIVEIIKSWRYFNLALKFLLSERKRLDLKERSRYLTVNPDEQIEDDDTKAAKKEF